MGILTAATTAAVLTGTLAGAGCYSPALRDCTVSCEAPGDCASGQVCGTDGFCAAPEIAGHCESATRPDAGSQGTAPHDAAIRPDAGGSSGPPIDASIRPDAAPAMTMVNLRVQITGKGSVFLDGQGACSSIGPLQGDCLFSVMVGAPQTLRAMAVMPDQAFLDWASDTCNGQGPVCTFTPTAATQVVAEFGHQSGPGGH